MHPMIAALKEDLAGCQKLAAGAVWPELSLEAAESRLSRVLSGELNPPPDLIEFALARPTRRLADYCAERSRRDPGELRERALRIAESAREQLELFRGLMEQADEIEAAERGAGMARVPSSAQSARRKA